MKVFELTEQVKHDLLPGVVDVSKLADWFWDEIYADRLGAINLTEEVARQNFIAEYESMNDTYPIGDAWNDYEYEANEEEWIFGGWEMIKGKYQPVEGEHGFSAIVQWLGGAPIVTVVAGSYYTTVRSMCSPCCPGQADLDSGYHEGGYACYSLPSEFYREEK